MNKPLNNYQQAAGNITILAPAHESAIGSPLAFSLDSVLPAGQTAQRYLERFGQHRWDWIFREYTQGATWQTEQRYPLTPVALWEKVANPYLAVGVRFGSTTSYGLVDVDAGSQYRSNLAPILDALESVGIVRTALVQSSASGGLHIFYALPEAVSSFALATGIAWALAGQSVDLAQGQCEIFPNLKSFNSDYHGHRLPLQPGSGACLLDAGLQPIGADIGQLLGMLDASATACDMELLRSGLTKGRTWYDAKRYRKPSSSKLLDWQRDLEDAIARGFTADGQGHAIIGQCVDYATVFLAKHDGELRDWVMSTLEAMPGYARWVKPFLHDVAQHLKGWMKQSDTLFALGRRWHAFADRIKPKGPNKNLERAARAAKAISDAVEQIDRADETYPTIRALVARLRELSGCSASTIYKAANLPLWHPEHNTPQRCETVQPEPPTADLGQPKAIQAETPKALINKPVSHLAPMRGYAGEALSQNEVSSPLPLPVAFSAIGNPKTEGADKAQIHRLRNRFACAQIFGKAAQADQVRREVRVLGYSPDVVLAERWDGQLQSCRL